MIPIPTNRKVLTKLGLYPVDKNTSKRDELKHKAIGFLIFALCFCAIVSSAVYFWKFATIDLKQSSYALLQIICHLNAMYLMMFAFLQRQNIEAAIEKLSGIYNERKIIHFGSKILN